MLLLAPVHHDPFARLAATPHTLFLRPDKLSFVDARCLPIGLRATVASTAAVLKECHDLHDSSLGVATQAVQLGCALLFSIYLHAFALCRMCRVRAPLALQPTTSADQPQSSSSRLSEFHSRCQLTDLTDLTPELHHFCNHTASARICDEITALASGQPHSARRRW